MEHYRKHLSSKFKKVVGQSTLFGHIRKKIAPKPVHEYSKPRKIKNAVIS